MTLSGYQKRALSMLLGAHCGDSLGATLEFGPASPHSMYHKKIIGMGEYSWSPGAATDDTDLMIFVLESLKDNFSYFDFNHLKKQLIEWADSKPKDIGNTTKKGIENLRLGLPLRECGFKHPTMYGNGSIMRAAPLALYIGDNLNEIIRTQCLMTHGHEICVEIDMIYVGILRDLLNGKKPDLVLKYLLVNPQISTELSDTLNSNVNASWDFLNTSGHAVWTLGAGLWALKQSINGLSPAEALIAVCNRGDDSDTCGAVSGAILGAAYGEQSIWPQEWLSLIQKSDQIHTLYNII